MKNKILIILLLLVCFLLVGCGDSDEYVYYCDEGDTLKDETCIHKEVKSANIICKNGCYLDTVRGGCIKHDGGSLTVYACPTYYDCPKGTLIGSQCTIETRYNASKMKKSEYDKKEKEKKEFNASDAGCLEKEAQNIEVYKVALSYYDYDHTVKNINGDAILFYISKEKSSDQYYNLLIKGCKQSMVRNLQDVYLNNKEVAIKDNMFYYNSYYSDKCDDCLIFNSYKNERVKTEYILYNKDGEYYYYKPYAETVEITYDEYKKYIEGYKIIQY